MGRKHTYWYAVTIGRIPGVYDDNSMFEEQVVDFPGAAFQKFETRDAAEAHLRQHVENLDPQPRQVPRPAAPASNHEPLQPTRDQFSSATIDQFRWYAVAKGPKPGKSQGMTLDRLNINLARAFEWSQIHVGRKFQHSNSLHKLIEPPLVSRARSLGGLTVSGLPYHDLRPDVQVKRFMDDIAKGICPV